MKRIILIFLSAPGIAMWTSCRNANAQYIDLNSGEKIVVKKDAQGRLVNAADLRPVRFYVDVKTGDTLDGRTGRIVNGELVKVDDSRYEYISVREALAGDEFYKEKMEKDGDVKIKTSKRKIKIDAKQ